MGWKASSRHAIPPDQEEGWRARRARPQARFPPDEAPWLHCCRRVVRARRLFLRPGRWRRKYKPNSSSGRAAPKAVSRVSPIGGGPCFSARSELRLETKSLSACQEPLLRLSPPRGRESFFKSRRGFLVLRMMARSRRELAKAHMPQFAAERRLETGRTLRNCARSIWAFRPRLIKNEDRSAARSGSDRAKPVQAAGPWKPGSVQRPVELPAFGFVGESLKKMGRPILDAIRAKSRHHGVPAVFTLIKQHGEGAGYRGGGRLDVVGVHDQGAFEFLGGARELRQDEHAGVIRRLRRHIFLGDEVHAVAQGRDEADAGHAIKSGEDRMAHRFVDVAQRSPIDIAEFAIDAAGLFLQIALHTGIFGNFRARFWRDLQHRHARPRRLRRTLEKSRKRRHALFQAL